MRAISLFKTKASGFQLDWKPIVDITYLCCGLMHIAGFHFYWRERKGSAYPGGQFDLRAKLNADKTRTKRFLVDKIQKFQIHFLWITIIWPVKKIISYFILISGDHRGQDHIKCWSLSLKVKGHSFICVHGCPAHARASKSWRSTDI